MPGKKNSDSKKGAPKKPLKDDKGLGESVNDELVEEEAVEEEQELLAASAESGAEADAGNPGLKNGGGIITDYEATIPIIIPPGARSPVDDIIEVLHREVIGQERAIDAIARALLRSREGFRTSGRPISTMFFAGPTGVGKTETVRALAKALHNDWRAILKVDCSEYSEPHAIARLIGAPPGYIGSDLPAILSKENVEGTTNRLILFDEIEKAHFRLHNLLLQIMDEGRITLARRTKDDPGEVSFEDCIVIMTSNVGAGDIEKILHQNRIGFRNTDSVAEIRSDQQIYVAAKEAMKNIFTPEFRNRLTEFIVFRALDRPSLYKILQKLLNISAERFAGLGFTLQLNDEVRDWLVDRGMDRELGVRPLVRAVEKYIDTKVAELHAYGLIHEGDLLEARIQETDELASDGITPKSEIVFYRTPRSNEQGGRKRKLPMKNQRTEIILRY
ncbi:MAG: ATP-dependent Clp protease ATP-binding subunit [Planctomycetales bacterium]|nr:ATP-dependent Clp protease ATP-binding subunit [bacterium]UNM09919.1 MAG: ATP-dependent Clp protease ATP-binding subunit [Planctomycetales bacterium]